MIAVSALAWGGEFDEAIADILVAEGVTGVEIAPTAVFGSDRFPSGRELTALRARWSDRGLVVPSIQSLLFGRPELQLFDIESHGDLRRHLVNMADVAVGLGAHVMVFGSPKNRLKGDLATRQADTIAAEFFSDLAGELTARDVVLTLEPNPNAYGADYLTTYDDVVRLTDLIGSPSVAAQIDTGCLTMSQLDPAACPFAQVPAHVHLSAPGLGLVPATGIDYRTMMHNLRRRGYDRWCTVEMLAREIDGPSDVRTAARWAVELEQETIS